MDFFDEKQDPTAPIPCLHEVFNGRRTVSHKAFIRPMEIKTRPFVKGEETFPKVVIRERRKRQDTSIDEDIERLSMIIAEDSDSNNSREYGYDENGDTIADDDDEGEVNPDGNDVWEEASASENNNDNAGFTDSNYDYYHNRGDGGDDGHEQDGNNDDDEPIRNVVDDVDDDNCIPTKIRRDNSWGETVDEPERIPEDVLEINNPEDDDIEIDLSKDKHFVSDIGAIMNFSKREIAAGIKNEDDSEKRYIRTLYSSDFITFPWSVPEPINANMYMQRPSITKSEDIVPLPPSEPPMNCITYRTGPRYNQQRNTELTEDSNEFF